MACSCVQLGESKKLKRFWNISSHWNKVQENNIWQGRNIYRGRNEKEKGKWKTRMTIIQSERESRRKWDEGIEFLRRESCLQADTSRASLRRKNKSSNAVVIEDAFHLVLVEALEIVNQKCAQQGMDHFLMAMIARWIGFSHSVWKLH